MSDRTPAPPPADEPEPFTPEAGEIEPAGTVLKVPPTPEGGDPPTEGDKR